LSLTRRLQRDPLSDAEAGGVGEIDFDDGQGEPGFKYRNRSPRASIPALRYLGVRNIG